MRVRYERLKGLGFERGWAWVLLDDRQCWGTLVGEKTTLDGWGAGGLSRVGG